MNRVPKIAIIEDDRPILDLYTYKFELAGYSVQTASDGKAGLALVEAFQPDLLLLDLRMPEMNGDAMLAKVRAEPWGADMRVIIMTNISRDEAPRSLGLLSVDRYIVKAHYTPSQVLAIANEVLK